MKLSIYNFIIDSYFNCLEYMAIQLTIKFVDDSSQSQYCPPVWDEFLCWPRTKSGEEISLRCPIGVKGLDPKSKK